MSKEFDVSTAPGGQGKVAIVTGANVGLGYETARLLAAREYHVVLACRNEALAIEAMSKIRALIPAASLQFLALDLASLESVKKFAAEFNRSHKQLDLLINNAGVMNPPYQKTKEGFELQIGVNYLAHFLLTGLLMETLAATKNSRIVTLSSLVHRTGDINFDDLQSEKKYNKTRAYSQSKLACLMFAYELHRKLEAKNIPVQSLAAHPGISYTNLIRNFPKWLVKLSSNFIGIVLQTAERGALPTLRAALDPNAKGGEYYGPAGFNEIKGEPVRVKSNKKSHNTEIARKLWELSETLTGFPFSNKLDGLS